MSGYCSIHRNFEASCHLCRTVFLSKYGKSLAIYLVLDTSEQSYYAANIEKIFLTKSEALSFIEKSPLKDFLEIETKEVEL